MKKIYALINAVIALVAFVFFIIAYKKGSSMYDFSNVWAIIWLIAAITTIVIGILQIIHFAKVSKHWMELTAGILTVLVFVPFAGIVAFVFDVIIIFKSKK